METQRNQQNLLRVLGLSFGIAVVIGGVVGQGILRTPGIVARSLPDSRLILLAWALGGILCLIDAFASLEMASAIPRAGGPYAFAARSLGAFTGTLVGWADFLKGVTVLGFQAVVFAEYVQRLNPRIHCRIGVLAVALIAVVCVLNLTGTKFSGLSQSIGSAAKALALIALVTLFLSGTPGSVTPLLSHRPALSIVGLIVAMRAVYTTYDGWNCAVYFCEEVHAPERNIVRATFLGLGLVTVLYILVNLGLLHVLTVEQLSVSKLPAADASVLLLGPFGGPLITALAVLSIAAIANLQLMYVTRIAFAMARDGVIARCLARVAKSGTPLYALIATAMGAAVFAACGDGYEHLIAISVPLAIATNMAVDVAVIRLRFSEPTLRRPLRMPLFPLPALLGIAINGGLLVSLIMEDPVRSSLGLLLLTAILVTYLARKCWVQFTPES